MTRSYQRGESWDSLAGVTSPSDDRADAIASFWTFWGGARERIAADVMSGGMKPEDVEAMNAYVSAIDYLLDWQLGEGVRSKHHLCVTACGDPTLRGVTAQWLESAPEADATWEYYPSRQPMRTLEGFSLEIEEHVIPIDQAVVTFKEDKKRETIDVVFHHPMFATIEDETIRAQVAVVSLEQALGEDAFVQWVNEFDVSATAPEGAIPLGDLSSEIEALAARSTGEQWQVITTERDGRPVFVSRNHALKRVEHPTLETHTEISLPLADQTREDGQPTDEEAKVLEELEDKLLESLGARGVLIARETWKGTRTIHLHTKLAAKPLIDEWFKRDASAYEGKVVHKPDPTWAVLERWS